MIQPEDIIRVSQYFSIISHVPGRIRLRVSKNIKNEASNVTLEDIEDIPKRIQGIEKLKINKLVGSITVNYQPQIFSPQLWKDMIAGERLDECTKLLNDLQKEYFNDKH